MENYQEVKGMLARNLAAGAVLGALLAGLFLYCLSASGRADAFFEAAVRDGHPLWEAAAFFAASAAPACLLAFAFGLFLPLGRKAIKEAKDRMLSGWLVGCLSLALIQAAYILTVLCCGSVVGLAYFAYCLIGLGIAKRADAKGRRC